MAVVSLLPDLEAGQTQFLLDTNFLFIVFGNAEASSKNINRQKKYLDFLSTAKGKGFSLYVTSFALSEFVNRSLRKQFDDWKRQPGNSGKDFKVDFRPSKECKAFLSGPLKAYLNEITSICQEIGDEFDSYKKEDYFPYLSELDFNDSLFAHVATIKKLALVTEDRDFTAPPFAKLSVVTANDTLYRSRN